MPALTGSNEMALAEPIVMRGNVGTGRTGDMRRASEPMPTITCSESLALAEPFLVPNFGEAPGQPPPGNSCSRRRRRGPHRHQLPDAALARAGPGHVVR
ncbi:hypothetical protein G6F46_015093 [Rhizopus delemar]|nr:hypothetical protein G6F46_015093 [Rhizopus delemar]